MIRYVKTHTRKHTDKEINVALYLFTKYGMKVVSVVCDEKQQRDSTLRIENSFFQHEICWNSSLSINRAKNESKDSVYVQNR
jgi:hypothetical protein